MPTKEEAIKELARRELARRQAQKPSAPEYDPTEGMGTLERLAAGTGQGMVYAGKQLADIATPAQFRDQSGIRQSLEDQAELDAPLLNTGAGRIGSIIGQTAVTAPIGAGAGAAFKGALGASRALQSGGIAGRVLGSTPARAAVEGGVEGAILAGPDNRLGGAAMGAGLGGGLQGAAAGAGRLGRAMTIPKMKEAAALENWMKKYVQKEGDEFIPISQAAEEGSIGRQIYEGVLSNLPGIGGKLRGQHTRALQSFRETAMAEALPANAHLENIFRAGDDIQSAFKLMDDAWDEAFQVARNLRSVKVSDDWMRRFGADPASDELTGVAAVLSAKGGRLPSGKIPILSSKMTGDEAMDLRKALQEALKEPQFQGTMGQAAKNEVIKLKDDLDEFILAKLKQQGNLRGQNPAQHLEAQYNWVGKKDAEGNIIREAQYNNWRKLKAAAKAAPAGEFTPGQLLNKAQKLSGNRGLHGEGGPQQELGKLGQKALKSFPSRQGIYQMMASMGALGLIGGSGAVGAMASDNPVLGGAAGLAIPFLMGRTAVRPGVQKLLMGQKKLPKLYADALRRAGRLSRHTTVSAATGNPEE